MEKARASLKGANISTALPTMPSGIYCLIAIAKISRITLQMLHFMQSQRPVDDPIIDALAIPSNGLGADGLIEA